MFVRHESRIDISIWTSLQHFNGLVERASVCQNDADCRKSEANSLVTQSKAFFMLAGMEHHGKISFPSDGKNVMKLFAIWLPAFRNAVHLESANIRIEIEGQISAALQHGMANPQKWKRAFSKKFPYRLPLFSQDSRIVADDGCCRRIGKVGDAGAFQSA